MRSLTVAIASSLLAVLVAACGGSSSSSPKPATAERPAMGAEMCPMSVPGTTVAAEDTDGGGALVFTTTGDVGELRKRVTAIAAMHNEHHLGASEGGSADQEHKPMHAMPEGGEPPPGMAALMHAQATESDVDGGARIDLAVGADDVAAVQAALREHAQAMQEHGCEMHHD